jgi:predicted MFS family arabinose efflux permease
MQKFLINFGMIVGTLIGGYMPALWSGSMFSILGIILSVLGGVLGIWSGYRLSQALGF